MPDECSRRIKQGLYAEPRRRDGKKELGRGKEAFPFLAPSRNRMVVEHSYVLGYGREQRVPRCVSQFWTVRKRFVL